MNGRRGFTLIELVVALVLTGVVALLVYGSAQLAFDTQRQIAERRQVLQTTQAMRALIWAALQNARPARDPGEPPLVLEDRYDSRGRPVDRLAFVAAGGVPPLSAGADWLVVLEPSSEGLVLSAELVGLRDRRLTVARLPGITGLQIKVLEFESTDSWIESWPFQSIVPRAIELTYWTDDGPMGIPQRLALPLGGGWR